MYHALDPEQLQRIQHSWQKIQPYALSAGVLFYQKLSTTDPHLKMRLSQQCPTLLSQGLVSILDKVVAVLDQPQRLKSILQPLALQSRLHDISCSDYDCAGAALLWTLSATLGDDFDPPLARAWSAGYQMTAQILIDCYRFDHQLARP